MPRAPKKHHKDKHVETRGRPEIPASLRRVPLNCRVPQRVLDGLTARADRNDTSLGIEVERLWDDAEQTKIITPT